jgi:hypothetical protein
MAKARSCTPTYKVGSCSVLNCNKHTSIVLYTHSACARVNIRDLTYDFGLADGSTASLANKNHLFRFFFGKCQLVFYLHSS